MSQEALTQIAPDLYQLKLPLPFALRIVNVYLLRGSSGWTILDTGINTPEARSVWKSALQTLSMRPSDIEQIVLTHVHPDHFGLAGWLQALAAESGQHVPIRCSPQEQRQMRLVWRGEAQVDFGAWLAENGMEEQAAHTAANSMDDTLAMTKPHPPTLETIEPGDAVRMGERRFRAMQTEGHSDGHLMFYQEDEQLLLSGDHVLMKITPNIGLWTQTAPDPLGRYLASLAELQPLPVRLALPGHRASIHDWGGRIEELLVHHAERLQHVLHAMEAGAETPYAVAQSIFVTSRFSAHEWRFAIAESLSHLEYLRIRGQVALGEHERHYRLL